MEEKRIKAILREGEELIWSGRSQVTKALDADNKKAALCTVILSAVLTAAVIAGYLISLRSSGGDIRYGVIVIMLAIGVAIMLSPFNTFRKVKKVVYAVTNKRILVSADEAQFHELPLEKVDAIEKITGQDGYTSLLIGSPAAKTKPAKLRSNAIYGVRIDENEERVVYPVFYNIPDADKVISLLAPNN